MANSNMEVHTISEIRRKKFTETEAGASIRKNWDLYLMLLPVITFFVLFHYLPMFGVQMAFKNYIPAKGIWRSEWIGFEHFLRFFRSFYFVRLLSNTLGISLYSLALSFPLPILLAIMTNEIRNRYFRKTVQLVTYAPHFLSVVVLTGMVVSFLSSKNGIVNMIIMALGGKPIDFLLEPAWFKTIYVLAGVWQNTGWKSIVYMAALAGIDIVQYEAAIVGGASKFQRLRHITIPGLIPTAVIILILDCGRIMNVGFEKVYLLQNNLNLPASDVIATYVYRSGIQGAQYSFSAAVGLFNSIINLALLVMVNKISKKLTENSLW